jgi:hypothetical protein
MPVIVDHIDGAPAIELEAMNGDVLSVLLGFLAKDQVGMLTSLAWRLCRCLADIGVLKAGPEGWREGVRNGHVVLLPGMETSFDARKLTDPALAAGFAMELLNHLAGVAELPEGMIRKAFDDLGFEDLTEETISILKTVVEAHGTGYLELLSPKVGACKSAVFDALVIHRGRKLAVLALLLHLAQHGHTDPYMACVGDLTGVEPLYEPFLGDCEDWVRNPTSKKGWPRQKKRRPLLPVSLGGSAGLPIRTWPAECVVNATHWTPEQAVNHVTRKTWEMSLFNGETRQNESRAFQGRILYNSKDEAVALEVDTYWLYQGGSVVIPLPLVRSVTDLAPGCMDPTCPYPLEIVEGTEHARLVPALLVNNHYGKLEGGGNNFEHWPGKLVLQMNQPTGNGRCPWVVAGFWYRWARTVEQKWKELMDSSFFPSAALVKSFIEGGVAKMIRSLERETGLNQLTVMSGCLELMAQDRKWYPDLPQLPQDCEMAMLLAAGAQADRMGYDIFTSSKSDVGRYATWKGDRCGPHFFGGISPLDAAYRWQRTRREGWSTEKQGLEFERPGEFHVVGELGIAPGFERTNKDVLVLYCDLDGLTPRYRKKGKDKDSALNADMIYVTPAGQANLGAFAQVVVESAPKDPHMTEAMYRQRYFGRNVSVQLVWRPTAGEYAIWTEVRETVLLPGSGCFKLTLDSAVKGMTQPEQQGRQVQVYVWGAWHDVDIVCSSTAANEKDAQGGQTRAILSWLAEPGKPVVVPDNLDAAGIEAFKERHVGMLERAGVTFRTNAQTGATNATVPARVLHPDGSITDLGECVAGYQPVVRTPKSDRTAAKVKPIKMAPTMLTLAGVDFPESPSDRAKINMVSDLLLYLKSGKMPTDDQTQLAVAIESLPSDEEGEDEYGDPGYGDEDGCETDYFAAI